MNAKAEKDDDKLDAYVRGCCDETEWAVAVIRSLCPPSCLVTCTDNNHTAVNNCRCEDRKQQRWLKY